MSASAEPAISRVRVLRRPVLTDLRHRQRRHGRTTDWAGRSSTGSRRLPPLPRAVLRRTYQLNLEDADLISGFARVLFVDATKDPAVSSFALSCPEPKLDFSFTSHAISVPSILATTKQCFGGVPNVHLLAIRGYQWELQMGLSEPAQRNLSDSLEFLLDDRRRTWVKACATP